MTPLLDSALINEQLVPIFPNNVMNPVGTPARNYGAGAGTTTLPGSYMSGSAVANPQANASSGTPMQSAVSGISGSMSSGTILGIPAVAFWIIVFSAIGYVILKVVHFHSVVEADSSV